MTFSKNTTKREERLMAATPEALETERASIDQFTERLFVNERVGVLDSDAVVLERELIDWRIDTFNRVLEQRPELTIPWIDSTAVYAAAEERAFGRQQAAEESFRSQWNSPSNPILESLARQTKEIREEWRSDLRAGRLSHALDSYFAGRVDQYNALLEMVGVAHPDLREALPPPIQYSPMREELHQQTQQHSVQNRGAEIAQKEARYIEQLSEQQGFGIAL